MSEKIDRRRFLSTLGASAALGTLGPLGVSPRFAFGDDAENASNRSNAPTGPNDVANPPKRVEKLALRDGAKPTLTIAQCGDPQLGFGKGDDPEDAYRKDLARLRNEIRILNEIKPDVVLFCGDMTNRRQDAPRDWPELLKTIESPVLVATGNHDVPDPVKKADVDAFRAVFGRDYASLAVGGWKLVVVNSQYCRPTDETALYDEQVAWFRAEIDEAAASGTPTIVASHVPPFVADVDEKDEYFNFPASVRRDYLDYCVDSGVRFYLAGHTHTTLFRTYRGVPILNSETTSNNFDARPFGFRLLKIDAETNFEWNFLPVED